ncbi:MAG: 2-dehydro-3-deoxyglucarate aldolase [Microvirga sp.]|jgi:4-hydroxy-2-oxoheptanedioate aldolase|nr:2-dehydro-3-deoxyglucarate aldolase [Microvirga sp.]
MPQKPYLKTRMRNGEVQFGAFVMVPSPATVEMFGYAGFDFVIIDREHGASSLETLENSLRAAETSGMEALVRIPCGSPSEILSALDAGASGIIVPHVKTAEQAAAIASAATYPPNGTRGIATTSRAGRYGAFSLDEHLERSRERVLVMVQIEDKEALPNVQAIAAVDGIDGAFIGPADLAMSLGIPGGLQHPRVVSAIDTVLEDLAIVGNAMAAAFAPDREAVKVLASKGVRMICLSGTDIVASAVRDTARNIIVR